MHRTVWCVVLMWATVGGLGCGGGESSSTTEPARGAGAGATADNPGDRPAAFRNLRTQLDLLELTHLADVDHHGLFIDFGTPARMKYTVGRFKTGWGTDGEQSGTRYTRVSATGRVYFQVDRAEALTLRVRVRPVGSRNLSLYLNNNPYNVRFAEGSDFRDYDVRIAAEHVVAGENHLLMRFGGSQRVGDEDVSAEVDSIRVIRGEPETGSYSPPQFAEMTQEPRIGGVVRRSVVVRVPTTLSWYLQVPEGSKLGFGVGAEGDPPTQAQARVVVTPEGGEPRELFSRTVDGRWHDEVLDLAPYVGKVVRLDFVTEGAGGPGRIGWSTPSILVPPPAAAQVHPAKNVVVLLIDTMRADHLRPFNPRTRVRTPVLDQLASESTVFTQAHSPENWTKPSVASVLTSLWPASHQAKTDAALLPEGATLVSEVYKEAGFSTASFIANGYVSDRFGFDQGWDHYINYIRANQDTRAENVFREAGEWIEAHKSERFFVYIQTIDPHVPYDPPDEFLRMYDDRTDYAGQVQPRLTADQLEKAKRNPPEVTFDASDRRRLEALYDGEVSYHDRQLGEFIERLKRLGLFDDTVFVITADHGEEFHEHGSYGHGHSLYEELLHVPLLVRRPGSIPSGQSRSMTVSTVDIAPTVLELTGVRPADAMEGHSLVAAARGEVAVGPSVAFSDFLDDRRAIETGRWKLILRGINPTLFDLETDPGEQHDLTPQSHPIAMRYCRILLGQFLGSTDRRNWLQAAQRAGTQLQQENAQVTPELRQQLGALGYAAPTAPAPTPTPE